MSEYIHTMTACHRATFVRSLLLVAAFFSVVTAFSCQKISVRTPDGFGETRKVSSYHAISPEGVTFRVRYVKNYPEKKLEFWRDAVKNHLIEEGYQFVGEETVTAGARPCTVFQWGAPYGRTNYMYLTAIIVFGREIAIAEASCEYSLFSQYKESLYSSIASIKLN